MESDPALHPFSGAAKYRETFRVAEIAILADANASKGTVRMLSFKTATMEATTYRWFCRGHRQSWTEASASGCFSFSNQVNERGHRLSDRLEILEPSEYLIRIT
jgi:hypothetical protein